MAKIQELENPMVVGYAKYHTWGPKEPSTYINTACDVCDKWQAVVQFGKSKLCDLCALEENIKIL